MTGASVWIGGLVALAVLGATLRLLAPPNATASGRRPCVASRVVATVCVGVMILTGLWTAWIHVGPPRLLFHTLYGETLLVKLILVLILVGLGAINQLWLLPRVNATAGGRRGRLRPGGDAAPLPRRRRRRGGDRAAGHPRRPLPLRVGAQAGVRTERRRPHPDRRSSAGRKCGCVPPAPSPGPTDYDVWAPGADGGASPSPSPRRGSGCRRPTWWRPRWAATTTGSAASTRRWSAPWRARVLATAAPPPPASRWR